ncbi:MAG: penicillin-binding protein, partial [Clostridia bacterium]|nr:penicillin-binding protein [Clostridia bacterium]
MDKNTDGGATRKFDTAQPASISETNAPNQKRKRTKRHISAGVISFIVNFLLTAVLICIITGIIVVSVFAVYIKNNLMEDYDIVGLETNLEQTTKIYYTDEFGEQIELEDQRLHGEENRSWISIGKMPTNLKNAFVAIEDQRFYEHNGMDFRRTGGAILEFVKGNSSYGGSTITQQLIKNFSGENDATIQRKIKEIFRAISLTKKRSKDEVLEMYLNTINLSNGCYGVQAAANYLFGKDVSELTLAECASLAAIPKSPYQYNPKAHPQANKERRDTVLMKMEELNWISKEEMQEAMDTEIVLNITNGEIKESATNNVTSYFTDALIEQLIADLEKEYGYPRKVAVNIIFGGGLKIHTTIDPKIQTIM